MEAHISVKIKTHYNKHFPHIQFPIWSAPQFSVIGLISPAEFNSFDQRHYLLYLFCPNPNCLGTLEITNASSELQTLYLPCGFYIHSRIGCSVLNLPQFPFLFSLQIHSFALSMIQNEQKACTTPLPEITFWGTDFQQEALWLQCLLSGITHFSFSVRTWRTEHKRVCSKLIGKFCLNVW